MKERAGGWVLFAAIILWIGAITRFFDALWSFRYHGPLPENLDGAVLGHGLSTYGWVDLAVAVLLGTCGFAVRTGSRIARWVGAFAGAVAAISAMWMMPYFPVWSLTYVILGAVVVYALVVHRPATEADETEPYWTEKIMSAQSDPLSEAASKSGGVAEDIGEVKAP